jgi:hypothetical protein
MQPVSLQGVCAYTLMSCLIHPTLSGKKAKHYEGITFLWGGIISVHTSLLEAYITLCVRYKGLAIYIRRIAALPSCRNFIIICHVASLRSLESVKNFSENFKLLREAATAQNWSHSPSGECEWRMKLIDYTTLGAAISKQNIASETVCHLPCNIWNKFWVIHWRSSQ